MRWDPSAENATVFWWKHCSMPIKVVRFMDQEFWQIFSQNTWCYRMKKEYETHGENENQSLISGAYIWEYFYPWKGNFSTYEIAFWWSFSLRKWWEWEKNLQSHLLNLFHVYARIIWGAQCQVKSPKLPFYCFASFEMTFYPLSPRVFKGGLILNVWLLKIFWGVKLIFFKLWICLNMRCFVF